MKKLIKMIIFIFTLGILSSLYIAILTPVLVITFASVLVIILCSFILSVYEYAYKRISKK